MDDSFIPEINCRFKIRKDLSEHIGFFQDKGVLTFNELGAFIVNQITGKRTIREIIDLVKQEFSVVENPKTEVISIMRQLQESGFF